ncbi:hypothetical protein [Novipirellula rosea]|uniref:Uncharacterized protein n=1 Tax=Novipirellula rosea TaxID=1031540 RepID=A0ABP8NQ47_9BACT
MAAQAELSDIIEKLTAHEVSLTMELDNLSAQSKRVGKQLDQIQSALSALRDGKTKVKSSRGVDATKKRTATPIVIQEIATIVLGKHDSLPFDQLLGHAKSELLARGLSRVGAKSMLSDAIKNPAFKINPDETVSTA